MSQIGHNKNRVGGINADQLKSVISRIEKLEDEKATIAADIRDVDSEANGNGLDVKTIRKIIKLRKMDAQEREESETMVVLYARALGMQMSLELQEEDVA